VTASNKTEFSARNCYSKNTRYKLKKKNLRAKAKIDTDWFDFNEKKFQTLSSHGVFEECQDIFFSVKQRAGITKKTHFLSRIWTSKFRNIISVHD